MDRRSGLPRRPAAGGKEARQPVDREAAAALASAVVAVGGDRGRRARHDAGRQSRIEHAVARSACRQRESHGPDAPQSGQGETAGRSVFTESGCSDRVISKPSSGKGLPMPAEWQHLSWRVIYPWAIGIEKQELPLAVRVKSPSAEEFMDPGGAPGHARRWHFRTCAAAPGSDPVPERGGRRYYRRLAEALLTGQERTVPGVATGRIRRAFPAPAATAGTRTPRSAHAWRSRGIRISHRPDLELAIALDRSDSPELAVDPLLAAIVLAPRDPQSWQSLSVVLNRLESESEANFASAFSAVLESEKRRLSRWRADGTGIPVRRRRLLVVPVEVSAPGTFGVVGEQQSVQDRRPTVVLPGEGLRPWPPRLRCSARPPGTPQGRRGFAIRLPTSTITTAAIVAD